MNPNRTSPLRWPRQLADVEGFPAELLAPLATRGLKSVGDLVARVKKQNPGLIPPASALSYHVWQCSFPVTDRGLSYRAGDVLAAYLGYRENETPAMWTDPPHVPTKPQQDTTMLDPAFPKDTRRLEAPKHLTLHPEAGKVPEMPPDQYREFLRDIKAKGVQVPIAVIPGTTFVIDGRTRLKAALEADLAAVPVVDADLDGDSPVVYMMRAALHRRHLKPAQAAALGVEIKRLLAAEMRQRKKEGGKKGGERSGAVRRGEKPKHVHSDTQAPPPAPAKKREPAARDRAAAISGSSARSIDAAEQIATKSPETFEQMKRGEIPTIAEAKKQAGIASPAKPKPPASKSAETVQAMRDGTANGQPDRGIAKPLRSIAGFPARLAQACEAVTIKTDIQFTERVRTLKEGKGKSARDKVLLALTTIPGADPRDCETGADAWLDYLYPGRVQKAVQAVDPAELLPCPFCGSENVELVSLGIYVVCRSCMACGPSPKDPTPRESRAAWNKRAKS